MEKAYFVSHPSRLSDLRRPHLPKHEAPFQIVQTIRLSEIDYENFSTDLTVDRDFIEQNIQLCSEQKPYRCLLVCMENASDGILVVPEAPCYVKMAAYYAASIQ